MFYFLRAPNGINSQKQEKHNYQIVSIDFFVCLVLKLRMIQCVPVRPDSFNNRLSLPEPWRGRRDFELSTLTGIDGCVFVRILILLVVCNSLKRINTQTFKNSYFSDKTPKIQLVLLGQIKQRKGLFKWHEQLSFLRNNR
jgi:hypothetical protein